MPNSLELNILTEDDVATIVRRMADGLGWVKLDDAQRVVDEICEERGWVSDSEARRVGGNGGLASAHIELSAHSAAHRHPTTSEIEAIARRILLEHDEGAPADGWEKAVKTMADFAEFRAGVVWALKNTKVDDTAAVNAIKDLLGEEARWRGVSQSR